MIQKETTGMILRKLRGDRTQEEIAAILGITKSSWAMYERDERVPRDEVKIRIANFFGNLLGLSEAERVAIFFAERVD